MERPEFEITITRAGKVKVHIKGVQGQRCVEMAALIDEIVGREDERKLTSDFYAAEGKVRIHAQARCDRRGS